MQETRRSGGRGASVQVYIPYPLREFTKGASTVDLEAGDLAAVIAELNRRFPGLAYRILDDQGRFRRYVNAFVNDEIVTHLDPTAVAVGPGDVVTILPSVAGG